ncbi:MAG TPA: EamA family transporter [Gaiellaceae bacterium]|nr:EamA family transporter [Gaiellaceae bacterium]
MSHGTRVWVALGVVYLIWGSTYLFIEMAGETIPPMFAVSTRFVASGLLMAGFAAWRRGPRILRVSRRELGAAALIGALLPGANAVLFIAERHVATGLSALIIGAVPLWIVLFRTLAGDRPPRAALAGVLVGFAGLAILVRPSGGAPLWALLLVVCSSLMWALGSFLSGRVPLPRDAFAATSLEMLAGGLLMLPIALLTTSPHFGAFSARSVGGWIYLVTFGSVLGYTAYTWLLDNAPIGKVATYAYVNPVVAIALGAAVLHESVTWVIAVGAAVVLASVALVVRQETAPPEVELVPAPQGAAVR